MGGSVLKKARSALPSISTPGVEVLKKVGGTPAMSFMGGSGKGGGSIGMPGAPKYIGDASLGQKIFDEAWAADAGKKYSDALYSQMKEGVDQEMFARGLAPGTEINDAALMKAKMASILGGQQMLSSDRGQTLQLQDRIYGSEVLPWKTQMALDQANKDRKSSKKGNTLTNAAGLGMVAMGNPGGLSKMGSSKNQKKQVDNSLDQMMDSNPGLF